MAKTIKMWRDKDGKAQTADVHPDEIANYQKGGWLLSEAAPVVEAEEEPKKKHPRSKADAQKK